MLLLSVSTTATYYSIIPLFATDLYTFMFDTMTVYESGDIIV